MKLKSAGLALGLLAVTAANAYQVRLNVSVPMRNVFVSAHEFNGEVYAWDLFPIYLGDVSPGTTTFDLGNHNVVAWAIFANVGAASVATGINSSIDPPDGLPFSTVFPGYSRQIVSANIDGLYVGGAYNVMPAYALFDFVLTNEDTLKTDLPTGTLHMFTFDNAVDVGTAVFTNVAQATGTVDLTDFVGNVASQPVTVQMLSGTTVVETHVVTLGPTGAFSFPVTHTGTFDFTAKAPHWLRQRIPGVTVTASGVSGLGFTLPNGDIDGNNEVSIGDYALLSTAFGSFPGDLAWNQAADLNGDDAVDIGDYAVLSSHFGWFGDD